MKPTTIEEFRRMTGRVADAKPQTDLQRTAAKVTRTKLQDAFLAAWRIVRPADWPDPEAEYRFHPTRKWRFDFAFPQVKVAVEIQGGNFIGGRHNRGGQQAKDFEKLNAAVRLGWSVLQFGTRQMDKPLEVAQEVVDAILEIGPLAERTGG